MLNMSWGEMAVIAVVTLIVVGPKELPNVLRTGAHWMRQARKLSREFQSGVDSLVREAELDEAKKIVTSAKQGTLKRQIENTIDPTGEMKKALDPKEIAKEPGAGSTTKPAVAAPKSSTPAAAPASEAPAASETPATGDASSVAASNEPAKPKSVVIGPVDRPAKPAPEEAATAPAKPAAAAPSAVAQADPARKTGS